MNLSHKEVNIDDRIIVRICLNCACDTEYIDECDMCIFNTHNAFVSTMQTIESLLKRSEGTDVLLTQSKEYINWLKEYDSWVEELNKECDSWEDEYNSWMKERDKEYDSWLKEIH